jgi:hypothetical protein
LDPLIVDIKHVDFISLLRESASYLRCRSEIIFSLRSVEMRKLAYECAVKFNVKVPDIWTENKCAWSKLVFRLSEMKYGPINQAA